MPGESGTEVALTPNAGARQGWFKSARSVWSSARDFNAALAPARVSSSNALADLEANEAADCNLVTELLGDLRDVFLHADFGVLLNEALIHETISLEEFFQHALENFLH